MKIAYIGLRGVPAEYSGIEKAVEEIGVRLVEKGHKVTVYCMASRYKDRMDSYRGISLRYIPTIKSKNFEMICYAFLSSISAALGSYDIVHFQAIGPALFTPLARILGMKVVMTSHGSNYKHLKWGRFAKLVFRLGEFLGVVFANKVIAISKTIADEIREKYKRDVIVIPNGVAIAQISQSDNAIKKCGLTKEKYILSVGRFVPEKGFHDLLDAFNELRLNGLKLVIVGRADHEDRYSLDLKEKASKNSDIVLTGFLTGEPLQELYSHAGLFVLPSYYEGLPIVLLEAISYGLLCLASDIPANRCVDLPDENYFPLGDIQQLSEKLQEFIKRPISTKEKSRKIEMLRQKYNWDDIAKKTFEVYREVTCN